MKSGGQSLKKLDYQSVIGKGMVQIHFFLNDDELCYCPPSPSLNLVLLRNIFASAIREGARHLTSFGALSTGLRESGTLF